MGSSLYKLPLILGSGIGVALALLYAASRWHTNPSMPSHLANRVGATADNAADDAPTDLSGKQIVADLKRKRIIVGMGTPRQPERIEADDLMATFSLADAENIAKLHSLKELRIRKSFVVPKGEAENLEFALEDDSLRVLSRLPNLEILAVSSNQITDRGITSLSSMQSLRDLQIQSDNVSRAGILRLSKLQNLESLTLYIADDLATTVRELARMMPKCRIEFYNSSIGDLELVGDSIPDLDKGGNR